MLFYKNFFEVAEPRRDRVALIKHAGVIINKYMRVLFQCSLKIIVNYSRIKKNSVMFCFLRLVTSGSKRSRISVVGIDNMSLFLGTNACQGDLEHSARKLKVRNLQQIIICGR
uniref:Uncharacterized protein n=2 Tax=Photinus pyralis TaxID=7054 RepID=A0A1Y1MXH8_PHOPY